MSTQSKLSPSDTSLKRQSSNKVPLQVSISYTDRDKELSHTKSYRKSKTMHQDIESQQPIKKSVWSYPIIWILIILLVIVLITIPCLIYFVTQQKNSIIKSVKIEEQGSSALATFCNDVTSGNYNYLEIFDASGCNIGDFGFLCFLSHLSDGHLMSLKEIYIDNNKLSDATLSSLMNAIYSGRLPELSILKISDNTMGTSTVNSLYNIAIGYKGKKINSLDFSNTHITDSYITKVLEGFTRYSFPQLNTLILNKNEISTNGTQFFIETAFNKTLFTKLTYLSLSSIEFTDNNFLTLSSSLSSNYFMPALNKLFLENINISSASWYLLKRAINEREKPICIYSSSAYICNYDI